MAAGYLRYPHIHGDLLTFTAGDEVWLAPAAGGRAWRLSADDVPVSYPRFSRDGARPCSTRARSARIRLDFACAPSGPRAIGG